MSETLLYIASVKAETSKKDRELAEERVRLAKSLGLAVKAVYNESSFQPNEEDELINFTQSDECAGLWLDVPTDNVSELARRLVFAAYEARKNLLGHQTPSDNIIKNIEHFIIDPPNAEAD